MATFGLEGHGVACLVDRLLRRRDGGRRLEGDAHHDRLAVGDAALHPTRPIGDRVRAAIGSQFERIVVRTTSETCAGKAAADLEAFRSGQRDHRLGEISVDLVEDRFAQAGRHVADDAFDDAAERIAVLAGALDGFDHACRVHRRGAAGRARFDILERDRGRIDQGVDVVHLTDPRQHFDAGGL